MIGPLRSAVFSMIRRVYYFFVLQFVKRHFKLARYVFAKLRYLTRIEIETRYQDKTADFRQTLAVCVAAKAMEVDLTAHKKFTADEAVSIVAETTSLLRREEAKGILVSFHCASAFVHGLYANATSEQELAKAHVLDAGAKKYDGEQYRKFYKRMKSQHREVLRAEEAASFVVSKGSTEKVGKHPDTILKLIGLAGGVSLLLSIFYDWGYLVFLGLTFSDIPTSLNDHVRSGAVWLGPVVALIAGWALLELYFRRVEGGMTEVELTNTSPFPRFTRIFREGPYIFVLLLSALLVIQAFTIGVPSYLFLGMAVAILWMAFAHWAHSHPRIRARTPEGVRLFVLFAPSISVIFFFMGYDDADRAYMNSKDSNLARVVEVRGNSQSNAMLLRAFGDTLLMVDIATNRVLIGRFPEFRAISLSGTKQGIFSFLKKLPPKSDDSPNKDIGVIKR